ncbi:MAG TPA: sulfatase-like hydrolase/transferase [Pirellulales bacterium]|jgi:hypothetical protein|nr:sulfatase-like hydrolase/transferase [Pirellulales bacterium]
MSNAKNIICLVVDRLHAGFIGAYGNTWISTPEMDRLAAESFLFDRAVIDSPRLADAYRAYWLGLHALAEPVAFAKRQNGLERIREPHAERGTVPFFSADLPSVGAREKGDSPRRFSDRLLDLPQRLNAAGYFTALLSDDPLVSRHPLAASFSQRDELDFSAGEDVAESIDQTQLAGFFASAAERLAAMREPFCLWLHTGSLGRVWDAPLEFRNQYADEDDPAPPATAKVPCRLLPAEADPDELLGIIHCYAGQISLFDLCFGSLLEALAENPFAENTLLAVLSARGFPLGEHGRVGPVDEALYGEVTQIPWFIRFPDGTAQSERTQALVQPADLYATLAEWCGLPRNDRDGFAAGRSLLPLAAGASESVRDRACVVALPNERAIVTPAWHMRIVGGQGPEARGQERATGDKEQDQTKVSELFVKPDDRFEVNEVADRCPDCVAELRTAFIQFEQSCQSVESADPPPLTEVLSRGLE